MIRPDGEVIWVHAMAEISRDKDGNQESLLGTVIEITKRRQMEEEANRLRSEYLHIARVSAMGELTASLAHELKQPLAAIRSNAQAAQRFLAKEKPDLDELSEILADIVKDNRRADEVIGRLRTLMRKSELQIAELNINNVIHEIFPLIRSYEIMRNISLEFELDDKIPSVAGDRIQLQQVILNLIMNSSEALENIDGDIRRIVIRTSQKNHNNVTVAIRDNGTGIDEQSPDSLFEPFYTTKQEGMGMGLPISRSIIEAHGGNLWAENNPDRGATFYFTIPVFQSSLA
jgi:C4-dicarboxylate-specific signal transduction histidine kinase